MDFPLYFQNVMLLWQRSIVEIDNGFFRVFGPYFIGKLLGTFKILIFGLWSFIPHPYFKSQALTNNQVLPCVIGYRLELGTGANIQIGFLNLVLQFGTPYLYIRVGYCNKRVIVSLLVL